MTKYFITISEDMEPKHLAKAVYDTVECLGYNPVVLVFKDGIVLHTKKDIGSFGLIRIRGIDGIRDID
jgi:hypothetical protein